MSDLHFPGPKFAIYGTRGSIPSTSEQCSGFGGATSCYYAALPDRHLILDAGTGIIQLGQELVQQKHRKPIDLVFSHFHYDHMMGLTFFAPLFVEGWTVRLWASSSFGPGALASALDRYFSEPLCPVTWDMLQADITLNTIIDGVPEDFGPNSRMISTKLNHPGGNAGFRLEMHGANIVYSGDFEHDGGEGDARLVELMDGVDLAILDTTYTPQTYKSAIGFGHAHWDAAGALARRANVHRWIGTHHGHLLTDIELKQIEVQIQSKYPEASLARPGDVQIVAPVQAGFSR